MTAIYSEIHTKPMSTEHKLIVKPSSITELKELMLS
jgi:hypothetical protein